MQSASEGVPVQPWPQNEEESQTALGSGLEKPKEPGVRAKLRSWIVEILQTIVLTVLIFAAVRTVVQNFQIDGPSMQPTLWAGQYLLVNKMTYQQLDGLPLQVAQQVGLVAPNCGPVFPFGGPQRGDIIIFSEPIPPHIDLVKRLIALPGDRVRIDRGRVYVNGELQQEDYIRAVPSYSLPDQIVPPGNLFVLGDNRPVSSDSHLWGFVPEENVIGKAWIRYWPPSQWGFLDHSSGNRE
jgi:signal peptidase I